MVKKIKKIAALILCIVLCLPCIAVNADETEETVYQYGYFYYTVKDNKITIVNYTSGNWRNPHTAFTELVIPSKIDGMKVVDVKPGAFWDLIMSNDKTVTSIVCSDYMTKVNMNMFNEIGYDIKKITLGKHTKKFNQYGKYYRHGQFKLEEVVVPEGNKYLKVVNGAVYSKDGTILWAFPAGRDQASFRVSSNTATIAKYAFTGQTGGYVKTVTLPAGITTVQKNAFYGSFTGRSMVNEYRYGLQKIKVPSSKLQDYKALIQNSGIDFEWHNINLVGY